MSDSEQSGIPNRSTMLGFLQGLSNNVSLTSEPSSMMEVGLCLLDTFTPECRFEAPVLGAEL